MPDIQQIALEGGTVRHHEDPIIPLRLSVFPLRNLQHADRLALQDKAGIGRGIMDDDDVQRVAIVGACRPAPHPAVRPIEDFPFANGSDASDRPPIETLHPR